MTSTHFRFRSAVLARSRARGVRQVCVGDLALCVCLRVITIIAVMCAATNAIAQQRAVPGPSKTPNGVTWGELALLPEFCADAQGILYGDQSYNTSPRAAKWVGMMGEGFWAIHHYCYALANVRRAESAGVSAQVRSHLYLKATQDYIYTLNNSAADMVLVPEILVRLGEAHLKLGDPGQAFSAFEKARQKKPDYWPAYSRWVEVLMRLNKRNEARDLAELGLRHAPNSEVLRQQFDAMGGDYRKVVPINAPSMVMAPSAPQAHVPEPAASNVK